VQQSNKVDSSQFEFGKSAKSWLEAGLGATAISASVAAPSIEAGLLHQVRFRLREREFNVLHHRERYKTRAATALLALMTTAGISRSV
jgi:DNA-binding transcriptional LysR family regulator